jgi:hypothetical protein
VQCLRPKHPNTNDITGQDEIKLPAQAQVINSRRYWQDWVWSHLHVSGLVTSLSSTFFTSLSHTTYSHYSDIRTALTPNNSPSHRCQTRIAQEAIYSYHQDVEEIRSAQWRREGGQRSCAAAL